MALRSDETLPLPSNSSSRERERESRLTRCPVGSRLLGRAGTVNLSPTNIRRRRRAPPSLPPAPPPLHRFPSPFFFTFPPPLAVAAAMSTSYERRLLAAADLVHSADAQDQGARLPDLGITADLKPHQLDGVAWLIRRYHLGVNVVLGTSSPQSPSDCRPPPLISHRIARR